MKTTIPFLILISYIFTNTIFASNELTATIIGSGSPKYNQKRASASVLISLENTKILVDMGNGTQANLSKLGVDIRTLSALVFTHHHLDHNEEFVPIFIHSLLGRQNFSIIGPVHTKKLALQNLDLYKDDISYRLSKTNRTLKDRKSSFTIKELKGGESFYIGNIKVTTMKVPHTIYTIAYRFEYEQKAIVITGDLTYSDTLYKLAKNADFMIIDSGGMIMEGKKHHKNKKKHKKRVKAHLNLAESSLIAQQANVKNLVYTHLTLGTIDIKSSLKEIRKNYKNNVIFAKDLLKLSKKDKKITHILETNIHNYNIVDTGQVKFYSNKQINKPSINEEYFGQDASYIINQPSYTNNNNGTVTDNITGLMWQKDMGKKQSYKNAFTKAKNLTLANYTDWRVPTIKELYSLILFTGQVQGQKAINPFIDTNYFKQPIGNINMKEREIDAQTWSSTQYVSRTMKNDETIFGVNFIDGRIKGYPKYNPKTKKENKMYFRMVRGNINYGKNNFKDNNNNTITDSATGLIWQKNDSKKGMNWKEALLYAKKLNLGKYNDWRLPNAKELQSIVDYTNYSPAINKVFDTSSIINEAGEKDFPYFWSSTTHLDGLTPENNAVYITFGKALGKMHGKIMDVHGAGAQRSDPKTGEPMSRGPQGDIIRVKNYVRCVRGGIIISNKTISSTINTYTKSNTDNIQNNTRAERNNFKSNNFIIRQDKNNDNKVSQNEFKGPKKHFSKLDKNRDGYITQDEAPSGPLKRRNRKN